jgi:hypothetical protein
MPVTIFDGVLQGPWRPASPVYEVAPWETKEIPIKMTQGVVDSVTTTWNLTLGLELGAKFKEIFSAAIKPSGSWTYGQTASISTTIEETRYSVPDPAHTWYYWWERAKLWKQKRGIVYAYNFHGYQGIDDFVVDYFRSDTEEAATRWDYVSRFRRELTIE